MAKVEQLIAYADAWETQLAASFVTDLTRSS
jgi:hypothetical protein